MKSEMKPVLLISASDSSCAAGMQVDLRVLEELGFPARCAVTALTVQGDRGVLRIDPADPETVRLAIRTALSDEPGIGGIKVGLVPHQDLVRSVALALSEGASGMPVVVDPVIRSTSGTGMAGDEAVMALVEHIVPLTTLLTPNAQELAVLSLASGLDSGDTVKQAEALVKRGAGAVLVTGGDSGGDTCTDLLFAGARGEPYRFTHVRVGGNTPRGTGCALSTALAAYLSGGCALEDAVDRAIVYVTGKIEGSSIVGNQRLLFGS